MIKRASLGLGIGWRPSLAMHIERRQDLGFIELLAENSSCYRSVPPSIRYLKERGVQRIIHGVSLSLGGAERPCNRHLSELARLSRLFDATYISEHIAFVRAGGIEAEHLLPVQRTNEALKILIENVKLAQRNLPVPLVLENIASLVQWPNAELDEPTFIGELLEATNALLLLDVSNLFANSANHGWDTESYLRKLPLDRLAYVHVAGGVHRGTLYHDTHAHPISGSSLRVIGQLAKMTNIPGIMLERDDNFPTEADLFDELDAIGNAYRNASTLEVVNFA